MVDLPEYALARMQQVRAAIAAVRSLSRHESADPVEPDDPLWPGTGPLLADPDPLYGWRAQSVAERSVLNDLADLAAKRGSWNAARTLFAPTSKKATHVV